MNFITLLVPLAVEIIKLYTKNSDSKNDDKVLEAVQVGCKYLEPKENNTLNKDVAISVQNQIMRGKLK